MVVVAPSRYASQPAVAVTSSSAISIQTPKLSGRWVKRAGNAAAMRQRGCSSFAAQSAREDSVSVSLSALEEHRSLDRNKTRSSTNHVRKRVKLFFLLTREGENSCFETDIVTQYPICMRVCNVYLIKMCQAGRREMLWSFAATAVGLGMRPDSANAAAPASLESENVIRKGLQELRNEGLQVEELRQNSEAAAKDELQVLSVVAGTSTKQMLAFFLL